MLTYEFSERKGLPHQRRNSPDKLCIETLRASMLSIPESFLTKGQKPSHCDIRLFLKSYTVQKKIRHKSLQNIHIKIHDTLFKQQASKTSISCEASSTFQATSFQNERFVRGLLNFSSDKLPKRAFRARPPQLFTQQAFKTSISCEASSTFQSTSFQNEHFVRGLLTLKIRVD